MTNAIYDKAGQKIRLAHLEKFLEKHTFSKNEYRLLKRWGGFWASGMPIFTSNKNAARALDLSPRTIQRYKQRFIELGLIESIARTYADTNPNSQSKKQTTDLIIFCIDAPEINDEKTANQGKKNPPLTNPFTEKLGPNVTPTDTPVNDLPDRKEHGAPPCGPSGGAGGVGSTSANAKVSPTYLTARVIELLEVTEESLRIVIKDKARSLGIAGWRYKGRPIKHPLAYLIGLVKNWRDNPHKSQFDFMIKCGDIVF